MNDEISSEQSAIMPVMNIQLATQRFSQVAEFVQGIMKRDVDFGVIPGTDKPTLLKPGAEKLTTFFGLSKRFEIVEKVEDWMGTNHNGEPFFYYLYRCLLHRGDLLIAESDGSCNSFEAKYRYRKAERVCPECGQANIRKSKQKEGGWYCWAKTGGCGSTFADDNVNIIRQEVGRVSNPDICDQVNTFQKMAQKRALVAATLLAVNASEFFTQDVEDYIVTDYEVIKEPVEGEKQAKKPEPVLSKPKATPQSSSPPKQSPPEPKPAPVPELKLQDQKQRQPLSPQDLLDVLTQKIKKYPFLDKETDEPFPIILLPPTLDKTAKVVAAKWTEALGGDSDAYHLSLSGVFDKDSANDLTAAEANAILSWLLNGQTFGFNATIVPPASKEAVALYEHFKKLTAESNSGIFGEDGIIQE